MKRGGIVRQSCGGLGEELHGWFDDLIATGKQNLIYARFGCRQPNLIAIPVSNASTRIIIPHADATGTPSQASSIPLLSL